MRTYGRVGGRWTKIETDPVTGDNSAIWLTTLAQVCNLNLGESPFWGNYGIPAQQTVVTQVQPDFFIMRTQSYFAPYFVSLNVSKSSANPPTYNINAILPSGVKINAQVPF
jgi:hypothetical protein